MPRPCICCATQSTISQTVLELESPIDVNLRVPTCERHAGYLLVRLLEVATHIDVHKPREVK